MTSVYELISPEADRERKVSDGARSSCVLTSVAGTVAQAEPLAPGAPKKRKRPANKRPPRAVLKFDKELLEVRALPPIVFSHSMAVSLADCLQVWRCPGTGRLCVRQGEAEGWFRSCSAY